MTQDSGENKTESEGTPSENRVEGAALIAGGTAAGAGVSAIVGGMGLVGGFGGVAIGVRCRSRLAGLSVSKDR